MATANNDFNKAKADAGKTAAEIAKVAQDAAYVAVGLGVLGLQKAQVRRRELQQQLDTAHVVTFPPESLAELGRDILLALKELEKTLDQLIERWDAAVDPVSERLPAGAQTAMKQAKGARDTLRSYLSNFAA